MVLTHDTTFRSTSFRLITILIRWINKRIFTKKVPLPFGFKLDKLLQFLKNILIKLVQFLKDILINIFFKSNWEK